MGAVRTKHFELARKVAWAPTHTRLKMGIRENSAHEGSPTLLPFIPHLPCPDLPAPA